MAYYKLYSLEYEPVFLDIGTTFWDDTGTKISIAFESMLKRLQDDVSLLSIKQFFVAIDLVGKK